MVRRPVSNQNVDGLNPTVKNLPWLKALGFNFIVYISEHFCASKMAIKFIFIHLFIHTKVFNFISYEISPSGFDFFSKATIINQRTISTSERYPILLGVDINYCMRLVIMGVSCSLRDINSRRLLQERYAGFWLTYLLTNLHTYLLTYLHTYILTYLHTYILTY